MDSGVISLSKDESSVKIAIFGAQIISWNSPSPTSPTPFERLYLSSLSSVTGPQPIRGGIPIVFPYFGPSKVEGEPQHGWARREKWHIVSQSSDTVTLSIEKDQWALQYTVKLLQHQLKCELKIGTVGNQILECQALFHNYFKVDTDKISILNLPGQFKDKVTGTTNNHDIQRGLTFDGAEIDRVYLNSENAEVLLSYDEQSGATDGIAINKSNLQDIVIWNPAKEVSAKIKDLAENAWEQFVCVEPGITQRYLKISRDCEQVVTQTLECI